MNAKVSAPMPFSAASKMVSRREQATQSGGCGFCIGLGTTLRGGIWTKRPFHPCERCFGHAAEHDFETFEPRFAVW